MRYFLKENPASPLVVGGAIVSFDIHGALGYRALDPEKPDDAKLLVELEKAKAKHQGGIVEITQAAFDQKKNLPPQQNSKPNSPWQQPIKVMPRSQPAKKPDAGAGVAKIVETQLSKRLRELGIDPAKAVKPTPPAAPPLAAPGEPEASDPSRGHRPMTRRVPVELPEPETKPEAPQ